MHRRRETKDGGVLAYLSGTGQRRQMFLPWVLITSYTTASARQCKCGRFSLPPYSKQERPLFTAALEQTSNVPTTRDVGRSSDRIRQRAWLVSRTRNRRLVDDRDFPPSLPPPLRFHFDTCVMRWRHGCCPPLNVPICRAPAMKTNFSHMSPPVWHINEVRI